MGTISLFWRSSVCGCNCFLVRGVMFLGVCFLCHGHLRDEPAPLNPEHGSLCSVFLLLGHMQPYKVHACRCRMRRWRVWSCLCRPLALQSMPLERRSWMEWEAPLILGVGGLGCYWNGRGLWV
jgi:hypothetical protein